MNKTQIEWVKNPDGTQGYTWNPITGCLNGCEYCYARKLANTRLRERYLANTNVAPFQFLNGNNLIRKDAEEVRLNPFYPRFWTDKLRELNPFYYKGIRARKARGIFTCDMSDLFGIGIPEEWTRQVLATCELNTMHRFYLLTKQPQNLPKFSPFPDNCWVGVSHTGLEDISKTGGKGAGWYMREVEAKLKYISFEPLLARQNNAERWEDSFYAMGIKWIIIGAQTKPYKPPKIEWVREIVEAADKTGIPVFLKNNLFPLIIQSAYKGEIGDKYVLEGKLRQEMPILSSKVGRG